jgi:hypothetical protein
MRCNSSQCLLKFIEDRKTGSSEGRRQKAAVGREPCRGLTPDTPGLFFLDRRKALTYSTKLLQSPLTKRLYCILSIRLIPFLLRKAMRANRRRSDITYMRLAAKLFRRDHAMRQSDSFLRSPEQLEAASLAWSWVEIGHNLSRDPK